MQIILELTKMRLYGNVLSKDQCRNKALIIDKKRKRSFAQG